MWTRTWWPLCQHRSVARSQRCAPRPPGPPREPVGTGCRDAGAHPAAPGRTTVGTWPTDETSNPARMTWTGSTAMTPPAVPVAGPRAAPHRVSGGTADRVGPTRLELTGSARIMSTRAAIRCAPSATPTTPCRADRPRPEGPGREGAPAQTRVGTAIRVELVPGPRQVGDDIARSGSSATFWWRGSSGCWWFRSSPWSGPTRLTPPPRGIARTASPAPRPCWSAPTNGTTSAPPSRRSWVPGPRWAPAPTRCSSFTPRPAAGRCSSRCPATPTCRSRAMAATSSMPPTRSAARDC